MEIKHLYVSLLGVLTLNRVAIFSTIGFKENQINHILRNLIYICTR